MEVKEKDFLEVEFDLFANSVLVQTTDEEKGKKLGDGSKKFKPEIIVLGRGFILKALDEHILKNKQGSKLTAEFSAEEAYGKRQKDMIKTFPKSAFDENKMRAIPGMTYDFNGMYGTVKSVTGGRVLVDFNNPLAGKDIKIEYKVTRKVEDLSEKISTILFSILRIPEDSFKAEVKDKNLKISVPEQLMPMKDMLVKSLEEFILDIKDYKIEIKQLK